MTTAARLVFKGAVAFAAVGEIDELAMRVRIGIVMQPESEDAVAELQALEVEELKQATRQ